MIASINRETADMVVVTGDTVHSNTKEEYKLAEASLNRIKHRVLVLPGDYDNGDLWREYFGASGFRAINVNGFGIICLDTAFMGHRYAIGWADVLRKEDPEQHKALVAKIKEDKYHVIFSHHPFWVNPTREGDAYLTNNVRAVFSGHLHESIRQYFKYDKPRSNFPNGFVAVPMTFHGNSCYNLTLMRVNGEIVNVPQMVNAKHTAW